jgi:cell division initiation protein
MGTDALDGDVQRLRYSGRGRSDGDPVGYRPVRLETDMTEPAFTLTPLDVRKQEFRRALRGYEPVGVDDFRIRVADELERVLRERSVLEERVSALTEQLRVFRERELAMNEALVAAQQLRQETRATAEREAQVILREAEAEARRIRESAQQAEAEARDRVAGVERQFQAYLAGYRALLERQAAELKALEAGRG